MKRWDWRHVVRAYARRLKTEASHEASRPRDGAELPDGWGGVRGGFAVACGIRGCPRPGVYSHDSRPDFKFCDRHVPTQRSPPADEWSPVPPGVLHHGEPCDRRGCNQPRSWWALPDGWQTFRGRFPSRCNFHVPRRPADEG